MPTIQDDAICIRRWDFSETSQTVSLLTRDHGIVRGLAKGAKRDKGTFSGGLDVLTRGRLIAIVRPGRDLAIITQWHLEERFSILRTNLGANRVGWYLADLIQHMLTEHDPHPAVYDGLVQALGDLADLPAIGRTLLRFQWLLLHETGYGPTLDRDVETGRPLPEHTTLAFSARAGGTVADNGAGDRWRVRRETIELLRSAARGEIDPAAADATIDRANRLLAAYFRELIGAEPRSLKWSMGTI